jgi:DNA invertase Pin-like site-specific DNA recombinase
MLMFSQLGPSPKFENDIRHERQADGIARAKTNGVAFGRKQL